MTEYRKLLEEIQKNSSSDPIRREFLGPSSLPPSEGWSEILPLRKAYIGPSSWYRLIEVEQRFKRK
jgi:hypothetical protein